MSELINEIDKAIKSCEDLPAHKRFAPSRELKLHKLIQNVEKYILLQLDILTSARSMCRAIEQELEIVRRGR